MKGTSISITRIGEALGAEVSGVDVSKPIAADTFAAIRKAWLDNLVIRDATYNSAGFKRQGYDDVTDPRRAPGARHGLVRTHPETGRKCLFLGRRRNSYIVGLELEESEALLDALWAHATQPRFAFRQQWQVGDLMIWDNRCTLHRRDSFDPSARRVMHRTQIKGDRPYL